MLDIKGSSVIINKNPVPMIYLDTCAMIALSKCENGTYDGKYKNELEELYVILRELMKNDRILCPLGDQLYEMGVSAGRMSARAFVYDFVVF